MIKQLLFLSTALLVLILFTQSSAKLVAAFADAKEFLPYPQRLVIPENISSWRQTSITEDDESPIEVIYSPLNSYVYGHYKGWWQCVSNASTEGYVVIDYDNNAIVARCVEKCRTPEHRQGKVQGFKDCQDALKKIKSSGVGEDQLQKELNRINSMRFPFRSDVF